MIFDATIHIFKISRIKNWLCHISSEKIVKGLLRRENNTKIYSFNSVRINWTSSNLDHASSFFKVKKWYQMVLELKRDQEFKLDPHTQNMLTILNILDKSQSWLYVDTMWIEKIVEKSQSSWYLYYSNLNYWRIEEFNFAYISKFLHIKAANKKKLLNLEIDGFIDFSELEENYLISLSRIREINVLSIKIEFKNTKPILSTPEDKITKIMSKKLFAIIEALSKIKMLKSLHLYTKNQLCLSNLLSNITLLNPKINLIITSATPIDLLSQMQIKSHFKKFESKWLNENFSN